MKSAAILYILGAILAGLLVAAAQEQGCVTDTECMAECPPPADDPELCDGGPQPTVVHIGVRG